MKFAIYLEYFDGILLHPPVIIIPLVTIRIIRTARLECVWTAILRMTKAISFFVNFRWSAYCANMVNTMSSLAAFMPGDFIFFTVRKRILKHMKSETKFLIIIATYFFHCFTRNSCFCFYSRSPMVFRVPSVTTDKPIISFIVISCHFNTPISARRILAAPI